MWSTGALAILLVCQLAGDHVVTGSTLRFQETGVTSDGQENDGGNLVCYYTPTGYFPASKVPSKACTHLIYAFGSLSGSQRSITAPTSGVKTIWATLTSLRSQNPQLKVMLSLQQGFPDVVGSDVQKMQQFAVNSVAYLRQYGFDGVDMDWEFPQSSQKDAYAKFFTLMRTAIEAEAKKTGKTALLLSLALPNNQFVARRSYDILPIAAAVDFATAMTYDFHVYNSRDSRTGYNSPLYSPPGESRYLSTSGMAAFYVGVGFPPSKLLLGIPTYGRSWTLANPATHGLHAPAIGKGDPGPKRHITGVYTYPDVCVAIQSGAKSVSDSQAGAAYLYHGSTWVAYDDITTVTAKCQWARANGLGGVGVWALHLDDLDGICQGGPLPLIQAMKNSLQEEPTEVHPHDPDTHHSLSTESAVQDIYYYSKDQPQDNPVRTMPDSGKEGDSSSSHDVLQDPHTVTGKKDSPVHRDTVSGKEEVSSIYRGIHQDLYSIILQSEQSEKSQIHLLSGVPELSLHRPRSNDAVVFMERVDVLVEDSDDSPVRQN
ncbi:hypothetical protein ACOMHN_033492 [Nucella lapillus]